MSNILSHPSHVISHDLLDYFKIISLSPPCPFQQSVHSFSVPRLTSHPLPHLLYLALPFLLPILASPFYLAFPHLVTFVFPYDRFLQFYSIHYRALVVLMLDPPRSLLPIL